MLGNEPDRKKREKTNWRLVLLTVLIGLALIGVGWYTDLVMQWPAIITGTFTSIGAAFLLAFVIFLMERRFTQRITSKVDESTRAIVAENSQQLSIRLSDLEDRLRERRETTKRSQTDIIDAMIDDVSYDTVTAALQEATRVGAIRRRVTVQASVVDQRLLVTFDWGSNSLGRPSRPWEDDGTGDHLTVDVVLAKAPDEIGRPYVGVEWLPGASLIDVATDLDESLRRGGHLAEAKALDLSSAIQTLHRALRLAVDDQHTASGEERIRGQLVEYLSGDWVITDNAIQNVRTGYVATAAELGFRPEPYRQPGNSGISMTPPAYEPTPTPEGIAPDAWVFVFERAKEHLMPALRL